jgi:hypothetical protein
MERMVSEEKLFAARAYLRMRFPAMAGAPLLESRVCQYENSTDHNFILDRQSGSRQRLDCRRRLGPRFQHGPVIGEMLADAAVASKGTTDRNGARTPATGYSKLSEKDQALSLFSSPEDIRLPALLPVNGRL